jgi:carnitine-CoA ligase
VETIVGALRTAVELSGGRPVVEFYGRDSYTAEDILTHCRRFAGATARLVKPGERVVIMLGNRPEFLWSFFGSVYGGAVPVPINSNLKGPMLEHVLKQVEPRLVIVEQATEQAMLDSVARTGCGATIWRVDGPLTDDGGNSTFAEMMSQAPDGAYAESAATELAMIMYTSGTTGPSKGIMYSHGMALEFADFGKWLFGFDRDDVMFNCLPLFHGNALLLTMLGALRTGGKAVFAESFSASTYWETVRDCGATILSLLGSMFSILWNRPASEGDRAHKARIALTVPVPKEHFVDFETRFGLALTSLYGLTDIGMPVGVPYPQRAEPGKAGIVHPDWACQIVDEFDQEVPAGTVGEMIFRPLKPNIMQLGYWREPAETLRAWRNLWFHTGDLLRRDEDGTFTFIDRSKDAIRKSGENISSFEVELVLADHPAVAEVAVYAVPSSLGEDDVMATVVLEPGADCDPADLVEYADRYLPYFAVPRYVQVVDALPKTATAKVKKDVLRATGVHEGVFDAGPRTRKQRREA